MVPLPETAKYVFLVYQYPQLWRGAVLEVWPENNSTEHITECMYIINTAHEVMIYFMFVLLNCSVQC